MGNRRGQGAGLGAILILLGACQACGPSVAELREAVGHAESGTSAAWNAGRERSLRAAVGHGIATARATIHQAVTDFDPESEAAYHARCRGLLNAGTPAEALVCLQEAGARGFSGPSFVLLHSDALITTGDYAGARELLFSLRTADPPIEDLSARILAAFRDDTHFLRPVETLERGVQVTSLRSLGGGSTITLKIKMDEVTVAAFKPNQTRRQSNYRAEIAAYRLCPMIRCGFEVPYSYEVRIEQRDFMRLYGISSLEGQTGYAANFVDLIWTREDEGSYIHGVWKDWVPHFTEFPIEYDEVWDSWVAVDGDASELDAPLADSLEPLRSRERGRYTDILAEAADATTRDLARQISNIIAFDFLINNWDRFSGAYYGVNCQWANGHFVSIDNGAGFMTRDPERPRARLQQVTRFSRSLVREVRLLEHDALLPILFPDPTEAEVDMYEVFWQRRTELLEYIDGLIAEHGEDAVLFFE